jgi:hypothetical protein
VFVCSFLFLISGVNAFAQAVMPAVTPVNPFPTPSMPTAIPTVYAAPSPIATVAPKTGFSPEHMKDYVGIGVGSLPLAGSAVDFRYWVDNNLAMDLMAGGNSNPQNGQDFNGNSVVAPDWTYAVSLGFKENLKEPVHDVFLQLIERVSYSQSYNDFESNYQTNLQQSQIVSAYLGLGFEAFIPFWESLSIEGSVGLSTTETLSQTTIVYNPADVGNTNVQTSTSLLSAGFSSGTFSILNGSVHFYF